MQSAVRDRKVIINIKPVNKRPLPSHAVKRHVVKNRAQGRYGMACRSSVKHDRAVIVLKCTAVYGKIAA